jgi:hypothetical protein
MGGVINRSFRNPLHNKHTGEELSSLPLPVRRTKGALELSSDTIFTFTIVSLFSLPTREMEREREN